MAYTPATAATFKARFPAFAAVADATIESALTRSRRRVDHTWMEDDRAEAEMLWAAHDMTVDGLGDTRDAQLAGFERLKLGSLELERDGSGASTGFESTSYGRRFMELMRMNHVGIIALGG